MDELLKEYLVSFYSKNLMLFGDRPESLRWSPAGQRLRYSVMLEVGEIAGAKILDYGCGKGDFYGFLRENFIEADYSGFDITPGFIELAGRKYPECSFRVFDIEEEPLEEDFDYIFLCGVFNNRAEGADETIRNILRLLFPHARKGLVFNALSSRASAKAVELHYTSPDDIVSFALKELTPLVVLRHDYSPEDFTLYMYPETATT